LPPDFPVTNSTAEIAYHPRADVCYASNRGHDSLAMFSIDRKTGRLGDRRFIAARGKGPRHFLIDPSGRLLLIANLDLNSIAVYRLDEETGCPRQPVADVMVEKPMCLVAVPDCLSVAL
jgi:6-phosphogluconolactonase